MATYEYNESGLMLPVSYAERQSTQASAPKPEMREIATTVDGRDITRGYVDPMMLQPTTDSVLKIRGAGNYDVYKQVLRDDQVKSCFGQRQLAVTGKEWAVDPGGSSRQDKKAADSLREKIEHIGFDKKTEMMLYGLFYGFAVAEAMWAHDGREVALDKIIVRDRQRFGYDGAGRLRMKTFSDPDGELMPDRKFWAFACGGDHDDEPYGIGLAHWLYWPVFFKRNGLKYWLVFLEKFGQPTAKGQYPDSALPHEKSKLLEALGAINTDSGIIVPKGMEIELLEATRSGTADYTALYDRMDRAIAKVLLGQTASTEGTAGRLGNDDLQSDVRDDIVKADADLVCESFNMTIARWLSEWNYPNAAPPRVYRKCEPEEDLNKTAERDQKVVDMGFRPTLRHIQDTYGGDWEQKREEDRQPVAADDPAADPSSPAFADPEPRTMAQQLDDQLQPETDVWINQVRDLVEGAQSLEDIRDGLQGIIPGMELQQYADLMAEALRVAELTGRNDIMEEASGGN